MLGILIADCNYRHTYVLVSMLHPGTLSLWLSCGCFVYGLLPGSILVPWACDFHVDVLFTVYSNAAPWYLELVTFKWMFCLRFTPGLHPGTMILYITNFIPKGSLTRINEIILHFYGQKWLNSWYPKTYIYI